MIKVFVLINLIFGLASANIKIATGKEDGTYYKMALDLQKILKENNVELELLKTVGSRNNTEAVQGKTVYKNVDLGITQYDLMLQISRRMKKDFDSNLQIVMGLHKEEIHAIVNINSNITLPSKKVLKVACGLKNSGSCITSKILSRGYKTKFLESNLHFDKALVLLKKGKIDMIINVAGKPAPYMEDLTGVKLIPLKVTKGLRAIYNKANLNSKDYKWQKKSINTLSVNSVIFTKYDPKKTNGKIIAQFLKPILKDFSKLKLKGHPKWKTVNIKETTNFKMHPTAKKLIFSQ